MSSNLPIKIDPLTAFAARVLHPQSTDVGFGHAMDDFEGYLQRMTRTMQEKVTFFSEAAEKSNVIIDFGCADGAMLRHLKAVSDAKRQDKTYIGYDISKAMLDQARKSEGAEGILFTDKWEEVVHTVEEAHKNGKQAVLMLSSVLHEILHYLPADKQNEFYDRLWNTGFDAIAIRDMMPSDTIDHPSNPHDVKKVRAKADPEKIAQWEKIWGSIENQKSLTHFILTIPYHENWQRELEENYFPISFEDFIRKIPENYLLERSEQYLHPLTRKYGEEQFGITLEDETHVKMIIRKARKLQQSIAEEKGAHLYS